MAYFPQQAVENDERMLRLSARSYISEDNVLQFFLEDLVARLDELNEKRPHNPLHPLYDRCFYSDSPSHYYGMPGTVQGLLGAIRSVKRLIKLRETEEAERTGFLAAIDSTGASPDGQFVITCVFAPFLSGAANIA